MLGDKRPYVALLWRAPLPGSFFSGVMYDRRWFYQGGWSCCSSMISGVGRDAARISVFGRLLYVVMGCRVWFPLFGSGVELCYARCSQREVDVVVWLYFSPSIKLRYAFCVPSKKNALTSHDIVHHSTNRYLYYLKRT